MDEDRPAELRRLEERLGHRFADPGLLDRALTHTSHAHQEREGSAAHNEPLEFLGDSVLGLVVADLLHRRDPEGAEGLKTSHPLGRHLACAKLAAYTDGSTEIQNERIGRALPELFGGD